MNLSDSQTASTGIGLLPPRQSAAETVTERLAEMIRSGDLGIGQRLPAEAQLASSFGVARSVVRESLGRLKALGLVVSRTGSGNFVLAQEVDPAIMFGGYSAFDLTEVRLHLEVHTAGLAAERRSEADLAELLTTLERLEESTTAVHRRTLDAAFHAAIAAATGNRLFTRLIGDLRKQMLAQARAISTPERVHQAGIEHRAIVQAIVDGDKAAAATAMRLHLRAVSEALSQDERNASDGSAQGD